ncbi:peptidyl-prolyl cis-trans isomerase G [Drosophila innubila]|uniref:peptidyl-prolyl cis-trans isomerase G n=1 Tax=Drosophila innubila TaxID=198719 RepID=UPI00148E3B6A|nr:peptidyl-prolyl cis-trans isomerase G [Drosophila innubila]
MDDSALTSKAIAELMREMPGQNNLSYLKPQERKINPLGKPNKRFLGRTINTALRHNKREIERTHASCQKKLQELDDRNERRKRNNFYTRDTREDLDGRSSRKSRSRKKSKKRRTRGNSKNSSRSSSKESRSRSRRHKTKHKKKDKKVKKKRRRRRSFTSSEEEEQQQNVENREAMTAPSSEYYVHSNNVALAVAMAYSQAMSAQQRQRQATEQLPPSASSLSDILNELMSDEELEPKAPPDAISVASSSDEVQDILTIDLSPQEEQSSDSTDSDSDTESTIISCISLEDSAEDEDMQPKSSSDIEIIETEAKQPEEQLNPECGDMSTTVDLTED